jgi:catechol 2,3-dioxygenase-like lactoylglutathione lyase family enzyme
MHCDLHHVHLFASDLDESTRFYREMFGAEILFDESIAGVRNVLIRIGTGHITFYDQPSRGTGKSAVHHLGIYTDDISAVVAHMEAQGFNFRSPIRNLGYLKYIMLEGPDRVLIEVFERQAVDETKALPA